VFYFKKKKGGGVFKMGSPGFFIWRD